MFRFEFILNGPKAVLLKSPDLVLSMLSQELSETETREVSQLFEWTLEDQSGEILEQIDDCLNYPNVDADDLLFEHDLKVLKEVLERDKRITLKRGNQRPLLSSDYGALKISAEGEEWRKKVWELRSIDSYRFLAKKQSESVTKESKQSPPARAITQVIYYCQTEEMLRVEDEDIVMFRKQVSAWYSHLYAILEFCDLVIAFGFNEAKVFGVGAAVAAKSALEFSVYLTDFADDLEKLVGEAEMTKDIGKRITRIIGNSQIYRDLNNLTHPPDPKDDTDRRAWAAVMRDEYYETVQDVCRKVLGHVYKLLTEFRNKNWGLDGFGVCILDGDIFQKPQERNEEIALQMKSLNVDDIHVIVLKSGKSEWLPVEQEETYCHTISHVSLDPTLIAFTPSRSEILKTLTRDENSAASRIFAELIQAVCYAYNLGRCLSLGALTKELHLHAGYCTSKKLEGLERLSSKDQKERKVIYKQLCSLAHPGWLIRLATLKKLESNELIGVFRSFNYRSIKEANNFLGSEKIKRALTNKFEADPFLVPFIALELSCLDITKKPTRQTLGEYGID